MKNLFAFVCMCFLLVPSYAQTYYVYVTAESEDEVAVVAFDGYKAWTDQRIPVGVWPAENEGPHGIAVSPDGKYWYLTLAHGNPYGTLYKFSTADNSIVGQTKLGIFPATMQVSSATGLLYCVNFNLHGEMLPSSVSVVDPETMTELKKITTGAMPHGSRISADGLKHYSVAMMSGELFEIDALALNVSRTLDLDQAAASFDSMHKGAMNHSVMTNSPDHAAMDHSTMDHSNMSHDEESKKTVDHNTMDHSNMSHDKVGSKMDQSTMDHSKMHHDKPVSKEMDHSKMDHSGHEGMKHSAIKPTWVIPHPNKPLVYVAANGNAEVLEISLDTWSVTRRFKTGKGPYNVEVTPDGKQIVVTYKSDAQTGIWDLETGKELAKLGNSQKVSHGIAITPDSKYAFVSVEGIGDDPGMVDVIDLKELRIVDTAEFGKQAGGIAFWKMEQ